MLTFGEPEADHNFEILKEKAPHAKRIDNVEGLLQAHQAAAEESRTGYFYVCDADAVIQENFAFKFEPSDRREAYPGVPETECVFTYRSHNPINDLIYGYGGLKLFPKKNLLAVTEFKVDMTTSIGAISDPLSATKIHPISLGFALSHADSCDLTQICSSSSNSNHVCSDSQNCIQTNSDSLNLV